MNNSMKHYLLTALILVCICLPVFSAEPNQPGEKLKFKSSQQEQEWVVGTGTEKGKVIGEWTIKPTYVGELFIWNIPMKRTSYRGQVVYRSAIDFTSPETLKAIMETPAGRALSQNQQELLKTGQAIIVVSSYGEKVGNHFHFCCYAVSEDDVAMTVKALIEFLTYKARELYDYHLNEQKSLKAKIAGYNDNILKKEKELETVRSDLKALSKIVHYLFSKEAGETVLELNKSLNSLDVEIAGLQAKVSAIEQYRPTKTNMVGEFKDKLEAMMAEQSVQLAGALAKKEASTKIRNQAEQFYNLHQQQDELPKSIEALKDRLLGAKSSLEKVEAALFKPNPEMLPPKVFQNTVTIYPVHIDEIIQDVNEVMN